MTFVVADYRRFQRYRFSLIPTYEHLAAALSNC